MTRDQLNQEKKIGVLVKIVFKEHDQRTPILGKFVSMFDDEELASKKMIRFVSYSRFSEWDDDEPRTSLTRIYVLTDITQAIITTNVSSV